MATFTREQERSLRRVAAAAVTARRAMSGWWTLRTRAVGIEDQLGIGSQACSDVFNMLDLTKDQLEAAKHDTQRDVWHAVADLVGEHGAEHPYWDEIISDGDPLYLRDGRDEIVDALHFYQSEPVEAGRRWKSLIEEVSAADPSLSPELAAVIAEYRSDTGQSADEAQFAIMSGDTGHAFETAIYMVACDQLPAETMTSADPQARRDRDAAESQLRALLMPQIETYRAEARKHQWTGWSNVSANMGRKVEKAAK